MTTAARNFRLRCVRGPVALSTEVRREASSHQEGYSRLLNLSGSGALFDSAAAHKAGDVVFLRFALPGQKEVEARAHVARVSSQERPRLGHGLSSFMSGASPRPNEEFVSADDRYFVGVAFDELSEHDSEAIVGHIVRETRR